MSWLGFVWDMDQESKLRQHEEKIKQLEERVEILHEWVQYLTTKLEKKDAN